MAIVRIERWSSDERQEKLAQAIKGKNQGGENLRERKSVCALLCILRTGTKDQRWNWQAEDVRVQAPENGYPWP
jgi:hypothetical protein